MNQKHVPFGTGIERPVDNLKFTAYKNILIDGEVNGEFKTAYEKAVQLIIDKKPVLGEPVVVPIRGGTDGSRLSFMGIPCPNLYTGGHNYHGRFEYACVESMESMVKVIQSIAGIYAGV